MSLEVAEFNAAHDLTPAQRKLIGSDGIKPAYQPLREEILQRLQSERPNCDTVTLMTMERISFIYAKMRQSEAAGVSVLDQKEFMKMYNELIALLSKIDEKQQLLENMQAEAVQMMVETMKSATAHLPEEERNRVLSRFVNGEQ